MGSRQAKNGASAHAEIALLAVRTSDRAVASSDPKLCLALPCLCGILNPDSSG